jgi:hypothetical protein
MSVDVGIIIGCGAWGIIMGGGGIWGVCGIIIGCGTWGDMMATVFGAAGVASITLGSGTRDSSPTPIRARFESSNSRGHGWRVK